MRGYTGLLRQYLRPDFKFLGLQQGRPGSDNELGLIIGQVRKQLSKAAVKGKVECLLSKLHQV